MPHSGRSARGRWQSAAAGEGDVEDGFGAAGAGPGTDLQGAAQLGGDQRADDLQMKLLLNDRVVSPEATVAARVVPAESVGGDSYNLFRLGGGKTGVMIGDVSVRP